MRIGLSLSLCVLDIISDRVRIEDVELIRANTMARSEADWEYVISSYSRSYWRQDPKRARQVVQLLRDGGRIHQHRLEGDPFHQHSISNGIWEDAA